MKTGTTLVSAILAVGFGVASAQQPGEQPGAEQDAQRSAQPGLESQPGEQDRERDRQIAAAGGSQQGDFLSADQSYIRTDELERSDLVDSQGEDIGNITGVLIDESGEVAGVLVNLGGIAGIGDRSVALPWDAVEIRPDEDAGAAGERYVVETQMSRQELENAPEFDGGDDQIAVAE